MENIINNQPIINIGCLGCVSDGKSTLIEKLTGIKTQRHSTEQDKNITIKQGYGNMKIWKNTNPDLNEINNMLNPVSLVQDLPTNSANSLSSKLTDNTIIKSTTTLPISNPKDLMTVYYTTDATVTNLNLNNKAMELVNHISFVDCPGHQDLIQTLLTSISLMDGAIFVIAVNQPITKKNQLIQHLIASKLHNLNKIIICLNKIDLVSKNTLLLRKQELDNILQKYNINPYVIIPTCFNKKIGLNYLIQAIMELFNVTDYINRSNLDPLFRISRSFDINKPGINYLNVSGGVLGGALIHGTLKVNDEIEIKPGYLTKDQNGHVTNLVLKSKIVSIKSEMNNLNNIISGGLIGLGTNIDPFYCKKDLLIGNIVGLVNKTPNVYNVITIELNIDNDWIYFDNNEEKWIPQKNQNLLLQIDNTLTTAEIIDIIETNITFKLGKPICCFHNQNIIICENKNNKIKII